MFLILSGFMLVVSLSDFSQYTSPSDAIVFAGFIGLAIVGWWREAKG
jgi:hypothetical protein